MHIDNEMVAQALNSGSGYIHIDAKGEILDEQEILALAQKVGNVVPPKVGAPAVENMICKVADQMLPSHSEEPFERRIVPFHTDKTYWQNPPQAVVFQYIDISCDGGRPLLSNCLEVSAELEEEDFNILGSEIKFISPHKNRDYVRGSCISLQDGKYQFRYRFDLMNYTESDPAYYASLKRFWLKMEEKSFEINVKPGDILIFSNLIMTHARSTIHDSQSNYRHMRRILLQNLK